jgi:RNA polymerase sigma-70 factor (ECF subfamily)
VIPFAITTIADDDDRAFMTRLHVDYRALIRKHIFTVLQSSRDMDDLINDVFVRLIGKTDLLKTLDSCTLASYIVYTVRGVSIDFIKRRDVMSKYTYLGQSEDALDAISNLDDGSDLERVIIDKAIAQSAVERLGELSDRDRTLLECKYILDMSDKEIASLLSVQPQSVRQYLTRARRNAMEVLREGGLTDVANI